MTGPPWLAVMVGLCLLGVWAIVVADILRSPRSRVARVLWLAACTLVWPLMIVYWLTRPVLGRAAGTPRRTDHRSRLVSAVLAHEAGRLDDGVFARECEALRRTEAVPRRVPPPHDVPGSDRQIE